LRKVHSSQQPRTIVMDGCAVEACGTRGLMARDLTSSNEPLLDYEDLFNDSPIGHMVTTPDGIIVAVNDTMESWTGVPRDELLGTACARLFPRKEYDRFMAGLTTTGQACGMVVGLLAPNGRRRSVALTAERKTGSNPFAGLDHIVLTHPQPGTGTKGKSLPAETPAVKERAEQEVRRHEALLQAVLDRSV
jgi:PAS domain S-box-containing protein